ncbi:hypothetical protein JEG40_11795, partial [Streptococcus agalactiae]|nr:hypothetical protein [Streptococcus agalactiae]
IWNIEQLAASGFAVVRDATEAIDGDGIGGPVIRRVTAAPEEGRRGSLQLDFDLTGPEEEGLSRAERRRLLEAA